MLVLRRGLPPRNGGAWSRGAGVTLLRVALQVVLDYPCKTSNIANSAAEWQMDVGPAQPRAAVLPIGCPPNSASPPSSSLISCLLSSSLLLPSPLFSSRSASSSLHAYISASDQPAPSPPPPYTVKHRPERTSVVQHIDTLHRETPAPPPPSTVQHIDSLSFPPPRPLLMPQPEPTDAARREDLLIDRLSLGCPPARRRARRRARGDRSEERGGERRRAEE